jgi:hypothetical protein
MKKEIAELSSKYLRELKTKLLKGEVSQYEIAHASFRKNNADWIIKSVDKRELTITYLCGDVKQFSNYFKLMNEVRVINDGYKINRKKYIARYYKIINALTKQRRAMKQKANKILVKSKSIANRIAPEMLKQLTKQI